MRLLVASPLALCALPALMMVGATPASAKITGPCTASATYGAPNAQAQTIVFDKTTDWHLKNEDVVNGKGNPTDGKEQEGVGVVAILFGLALPVYGNSDKGSGGSAGPFKVSDYSKFGRLVAAAGSSGGGTCTGAINIVVDDVNPAATVAGGGGLVLGALGLLGVLGAAVKGSGAAGSRILGGFSGLIGGIGLGVFMQQAGTLDPTNLIDLVVPGVGLVVGAAAAGALNRGGKALAPR